MDLDESIFCQHCNENVSRSTYRRHQLNVANLKRRHVHMDKYNDSRSESETSESDSDAEKSLSKGSDVQDAFNDSDVSLPSRPGEKSRKTQGDECEQSFIDEVISNNVDELVSESDIERSGDDDSDDDNDGHSVGKESGASTCGDNVEEHWEEVPSDIIDKDIEPTPLPEPVFKKNKIQEVNALVFWFVYFLLLWQTSCKISDNGLAWLLQFIVQFLKMVGFEVPNVFLAELISLFPTSVYLLKQFINYDKDAFTKYVVCPRCTKLYTYYSCLQMVNNKTVPKTCNSTYMSRSKRKVCGASMVKKVILNNKTEKFYPITYYCYNSIINELEKLLQQKEFPGSCEKWRNQNQTTDVLTDVYNGQIWKDFQTYKGTDFLKAPRNYGLMLNFDFFQPMKHRKDYSVGVLYLVILNLPRIERFKWKNVIVIGIIPSINGMEPKCLNEFLKPAIKELQCLWKGIRLKSSISSVSLTFRAALLSVTADIPAARKLCGFKGHSAHHGCSRCLKLFPGGFKEKKDYSGFDRENWKKRNDKEHRLYASKIERTKKMVKKKELCKEYGINYWSPFLDLEYFDVVRFCTVDPMHNLFLGTAKYVFKLWDKRGIISKKGMKSIEERIEKMDVPSNIGRLPKKISSNYGSYTAEQWKNWTLIYSMFALKDVIRDDHLRCWQSFVLACKFLCRANISSVDIQKADFLLLKFCKGFQQLYGKLSVTPNMHLHCHLKEIINDHGPVYSFWCFSFERYNGIMGSITTNKRSLELQLMRKLMISRFLDGLQMPQQYQSEFQHLICRSGNIPDGHLNVTEDAIESQLCGMSTAFPIENFIWSLSSNVRLPSEYILESFESSDLDILLTVYEALYPDELMEKSALAETVKKYSSVNIGNEHYGSKLDCRSMRSSRIYASWAEDDGGLNLERKQFYAGKVDYYFSHSLTLNGKCLLHVFACVLWLKPDVNPDLFWNPTKTWKARDYIEGGPSRFMPVQRIHCRYAGAEIMVGGEMKMVTVPLDLKGHST